MVFSFFKEHQRDTYKLVLGNGPPLRITSSSLLDKPLALSSRVAKNLAGYCVIWMRQNEKFLS